MTFKEIIGHNSCKEYLQSAIATGHVSHAYLLYGERFSGKHMMAQAFSKMLECTDRTPIDACNTCKNCLLAEKGNHPDIITVSKPEGKKSIPIKDIREQIIESMDIRPFCGAYKIYIVDGADSMSENVQNVLLKSLEESPSYVVIFLLAQSKESILPTIRSRCTELYLTPVSKEDEVAFLKETYNLSEMQAQAYARFSFGNVGKAIEFCQKEEYSLMQQDIAEVMYRLAVKRDLLISEAIQGLHVTDKEWMPYYFELVELWFRDVLLYKATKGTAKLIYANQTDWIEKQEKRSTYKSIHRIFIQLFKAKELLSTNMDAGLLLERLFIEIKENA